MKGKKDCAFLLVTGTEGTVTVGKGLAEYEDINKRKECDKADAGFGDLP